MLDGRNVVKIPFHILLSKINVFVGRLGGSTGFSILSVLWKFFSKYVLYIYTHRDVYTFISRQSRAAYNIMKFMKNSELCLNKETRDTAARVNGSRKEKDKRKRDDVYI